MEIFIDDIPEEGMMVRADAKSDPWFSHVLKGAIGNRFTDDAFLSVTIIRFEENVDITGELKIVSKPVCDRCLKAYTEKESIPFHVLLAPLYESRQQKKEEAELEKELVREDFEFGFYDGDKVNLDEIIREQVLLAEPFKHLCKENCKGLCQRCGKDLNDGPCDCVEDRRDPRWTILKNFKPKGEIS